MENGKLETVDWSFIADEARQLRQLVKPEAWAVNPGAVKDQQKVTMLLGSFFKRADEVVTPKRYTWFRRDIYIDEENKGKRSFSTAITFIQQGDQMEDKEGLVDIFYQHERRSYPHDGNEEKQHRRKMEWRRLIANENFVNFCEKNEFKFVPLIEWVVARRESNLFPWKDYKMYYLTEVVQKICPKLFKSMHCMYCQMSMYRRMYHASSYDALAASLTCNNLERKLSEKRARED